MSISPQQIERLLISRLLLEQAIRQLEAGGQYSEGFAVLSLHDCVELALRVIGENVNAPIRDHESFNGLIDKIEKKTDSLVPWRGQLFRLNKSRVDFKHLGMLPRSEDIREISVHIKDFLTQSFNQFLDLHLSDISFADAIADDAVRDALKMVEKDIEISNYQDAVVKCAQIWPNVLQLFPKIEEESWSNSPRIRPPVVEDYESKRSFEEFSRSIEEEFRHIRSDIRLLMYGIDIRDYRRFKAIPLHVMETMGGRTIITHTRSVEFYDQARANFCLRFLINTSLLAEQMRRERNDGQRSEAE